MRRALYAGSFDPITNGHMWVIGQGSNLFDNLIVSVAHNHNKSSLFSGPEKVQLIKDATIHLKNVEVILGGNSEYTANLAAKHRAAFLLRGLRNATDFEYEKNLDHINSQIVFDLQTVYLIPPQSHELISSSMIKALIGPKGWVGMIRESVPLNVLKAIVSKQCINEAEWYYPLKGLILNNYLSPDRYYHTFDHVLHCLDEFSDYIENDCHPTNAQIIKAALVLHDLYYDSKAKDNEDRSAHEAAEMFHKIKHHQSADMVKNLILATKHHNPKTLEEKIVCDIDLSILGQSRYEYIKYTYNIRDEYSWVPDEEYYAARYNFMKKFLERPCIYNTSFFNKKYEAAAIDNLKYELALLEAELLAINNRKEVK